MRSLIAVVAGWLVAVIAYQMGAVVALLSLHGIPLGASIGPPGLADFALHFASAAAASVLGGWVTARVSRIRPVAHCLALSVALAVFVLWGFGKQGSQWPKWYPPAVALVGTIGALGGGLLRRRRI